MTRNAGQPRCTHWELAPVYALGALPQNERPAFEAHLAACSECRQELATLKPVVDSFVDWPTEVLRPTSSLWGRLAGRIGAEAGETPILQASEPVAEPDWEEPSPGIFCKLLATDAERDRVSLLVRLAPGVPYPAHIHGGVEELHLLYGELWIDDRKLVPGDYNRAEAGSADTRVWSEGGCTCVLITSSRDILR